MPKAGRLYIPIDVHLFDEAWAEEVSELAALHFVKLLCRSKSLNSKGLLSRRQIDKLIPICGHDDIDTTTELIRSKMLIPAGQIAYIGSEIGSDMGATWYRLRGWDEWNETDPQSEAAARTNHKRWHADRDHIEPSCAYCVPGQIAYIGSESLGDSLGDSGSESLGESPVEKSRVKKSRGGGAPRRTPRKPETPMPDNFALTSSMRATPTARECVSLGIDLDYQFGQFVTHHQSHENRFRDWPAAVQTWFGRQIGYEKERRAKNGLNGSGGLSPFSVGGMPQ